MAVTLTSLEYQLYYRLHFSLLFYVAKEQNILDVSKISSWKQFQDQTTLKQKQKVREVLYKNIAVIDTFIEKNLQKFTTDELAIIENWKNFLRGKFYIVQSLKDYAVFLSTQKQEKVYGVKALQDTFEVMMSYDPPVLVETVLLPFNEHIIYDGILFATPVIFGAGIRHNIQQAYQEAKARFGIISSLPELKKEQKPNNEELLKFYLKNDTNREYYIDEIETLLKKQPLLIDTYYHELGKADARKFVRRFREIGIKKVWYATLQGIIIASGMSKEEIDKTVRKMVQVSRLKQVYIFQVI